MQGQRVQRVNDLLRRVLAEVIEEEVRDPRIGFVTVTGVDTSPDLRHARVWVTVLGSHEDAEKSIKVLNRAGGFLRTALKRQVDLRLIPELQFVFDPTIERADRIDRLLREADHPESGGDDASTGGERTR